MILKFKDRAGQWSWVAGVDELQQLGKALNHRELMDEYDVESVEYLGDANATNIPPSVIYAVTNGEPRLLAVNCTEAYLCNSETGSTIDVVYQGG